MAVTRKTLSTNSTSSGLPQDPMTVDPNVCVPATIGVSPNPTDVANLANPANTVGPTNLTDTISLVDPANPADPNEKPLLPRVDPPLAPLTEGFVNVEQPPHTTTNSVPQYYTGETSLGIGEPAIGEPHVDLGEDI
uniref:Uncharacterized protein n=1 Tax=Cannabis sativa TaxID=3483 RepID=A0A803P9V0_CANSA